MLNVGWFQLSSYEDSLLPSVWISLETEYLFGLLSEFEDVTVGSKKLIKFNYNYNTQLLIQQIFPTMNRKLWRVGPGYISALKIFERIH